MRKRVARLVFKSAKYRRLFLNQSGSYTKMSECLKNIKSTSCKLYYQVPDDNCCSVRKSQNVVKLCSSSGDKRAFKIRFSDPNLIKGCGGSAGVQPNRRVGGSNVTSPSKRPSSSSTRRIRKHVSITFVIPTLPTATRYSNTSVISSSSVASPSTATSEASRAAASRIAECAFVLVFRSID
jgi:hypothetical protein